MAKKKKEKVKVNSAPIADQVSADNSDEFNAADVDEVMRKYDKESNTRIWEGTLGYIVRAVSVLFSLYCIWNTLFGKDGIQERLAMFLGMILVLGYLYYPASKKHVVPNKMPWYDFIIMLAGAGCMFYFRFSYQKLMAAGVLNSASMLKFGSEYFYLVIVAAIAILSLAELCRRSVGIPILFVVGALLVYAFFNIGFEKYNRVAYSLFYTTSGVFGTPVNVCAKFIVVFIIFGAFLERTGIATFFIDLANSLFGSAAGGPAKVAVVSSALCGMVSGSSVGNTVTTGSVTIPMMKKTGYKPEFAGAVEAAASTGGQIMPPIMGAAAFLMAEYMGISYGSVALRAILPAILYFAGIFIAVHLEARKLGLKGVPKSELPKFRKLLPKFYLLLPLVILVYLVSTNAKTMAYAAAISIIACLVVGLVDMIARAAKETDNFLSAVWHVLKDLGVTIFNALEAGGKGTISVAVACAMAGMIAGCITVTGLASQLINAIVNASGNHLIIGLFLTMLCCIVLGMGVPTTANYCIMASTCAPILIQLGLPVVAAHFFVFYFGIVADITPPVALAAYAGSAIAKSNPMKTGINATKLAIAAFIVPYIFAYNPAMILEGLSGWFEIIQISLSSIIGLYGVAVCLSGFLYHKIHPIVRVLLAAGGLLMMVPGTWTDLAGLAVVAACILFQKKTAKSDTPLAA